jgi:uncharacterized FlgJ-related protein
MALIVLDCSSTWCQTHHLLTIKFEHRLMSAVQESGAAHIASVAERAPHQLIGSIRKSASVSRSMNKHQKVPSLTKKKWIWLLKVKSS